MCELKTIKMPQYSVNLKQLDAILTHANIDST